MNETVSGGLQIWPNLMSLLATSGSPGGLKLQTESSVFPCVVGDSLFVSNIRFDFWEDGHYDHVLA